MWLSCLLPILWAWLLPVVIAAKSKCGGHLTAVRGIVQTPAFPAAFPVPIHCEWIIDSQNSATENTVIIVYLTQMFLFEGITFSEYQIYDNTFQFNGKTLLKVNESNIVESRTVQTSQNFLVITLDLASIDSVHLRVLDNLLDVFGFNITYEITQSQKRSPSCSMIDCSFNGMCFDHYTKFTCDCFKGYSGPFCSNGVNSICNASGVPFCENNGTCIQIGSSEAKCKCLEGFTGDNCEATAAERPEIGCKNCPLSCPFNGDLGNICKCNGSTDTIGFSSTMHLANLPSKYKGATLEAFIENQVINTLKEEGFNFENVLVNSLDYFREGADVNFLIYASQTKEEQLKVILSKWANRGYLRNITITEKDIYFRPVIALQGIYINSQGPLREHDDFILSCIVRGSQMMNIRWLKDGLLVNASSTAGKKWTRVIRDPNDEDKYTALLGIKDANYLETGVFECQIEELGFQQCAKKNVVVKKRPSIKIKPMSLTVKKGENFTIKCGTDGEKPFNKYIYSWTKNRELLPIRTDKESYEILYPSGSILQVFAIDKSTKYSCLVSDETVSSEISMDVHVVDPKRVRTCKEEKYLSELWPETSPDSESIQECPKGYKGLVRRLCRLEDVSRPMWNIPDYSGCTANFLEKTSQNFQKLILGYNVTTVSASINAYLTYIQQNSFAPTGTSNKDELFLPGEGARVLSFLDDVISFMNSPASWPVETEDTNHLLLILDKIMGHKEALINQEHIKLLQKVVKSLLGSEVFSKRATHLQSAFQNSFTTLHVNMASLDKSSTSVTTLPLLDPSHHQNWLAYKLRVNMGRHYFTKLGNTADPLLVSVVYRNLSSFLPTRSVIRSSDGSEIEYEIISQISSVWLFQQKPSFEELHRMYNTSIVMEFRHGAKNAAQHSWITKCATSEYATFGYAWDIQACHARYLNATTTRCSCPNVGTFAVLLTSRTLKVNTTQIETYKLVVVLGCSSCLLLSLTSAVILFSYWCFKKSCILFLKMQCCLSTTGAMASFILGHFIEKEFYTHLMILLETCFLVGLSTQLSKLLVIYTEIVNFPKPQSTKQTVIGIITGVPLITVFASHIAHQTMNKKYNSWWLIYGTFTFYVFVICFCIIIVLYIITFVLLYIKIRTILKNQKKVGSLQQRLFVLRRSACVFLSIVITTSSSVIYINFCKETFWYYEFSISASILGLVLVICYIIKTENVLYPDILQKVKSKKNDVLFNTYSGDPLNFYTKEEPDVESESTPDSKKSFSTNCDVLQNLPPQETLEIEPCTSEDIEKYNSSPKHFPKKTGIHNIEKINIMETKLCNNSPKTVCLDLDLVVLFSMQDKQNVNNFIKPIITITPSENTDAQEEQCPSSSAQIDSKTTFGTTELDGVLHSISQDLDYLLNDNDTFESKKNAY